MKAKPILKLSNFSEDVKSWSYGRFMSVFGKVYPKDQLNNVASEMGLRHDKKKKAEDADKPIHSPEEE